MGIIVLYKMVYSGFFYCLSSVYSRWKTDFSCFSSAMMACSSFSRSAFLELGNQSFS